MTCKRGLTVRVKKGKHWPESSIEADPSYLYSCEIGKLERISGIMAFKKRLAVRWLLGLALFAGSLPAFAQKIDSMESNKKTIDSVLGSEGLIELRGSTQVYYSHGFDIRAKTVQRLVSNCIDFYRNAFPGAEFAVHLYLLDEADWGKANFGSRFPYGMPFYDPDYDILVIPAEKTALAKLSGAKNIPETPDSVLSGLDYQPLHELGHYFFFTVNKINKEKWFNEFLATYFLICYVKESQLAPELQQILQPHDAAAKYKTIEAFDHIYLGVGPANYGWYQCQFAQLGYMIYPKLKLKLIRKVLDNYKEGGKNLDGVAQLEALAPHMVNEWLAKMQ
ncbi:MAG TPA: hypothetical protein VN616_14675 [Puia sp.]|nr:hypothetical protein [Puia sp.]